MKAYADLVKSVAQTVARFAQENISDDDGRDYLAERYAEYFEIDENRCLQLRENVDRREALKRLRRLVPDGGLKRLDASAITTILIEAARRRIVANRQQLLASMVVMGIRRIDAKRKKRPRK
jgi:hypothetical protein